ncbi:hypothetical protein TorRG33x02_163750 [Trema orientale]|uniref:Tetraspanin/Peripherin n=1 Tax=Trema orientale TaxID=63057 RepID=A0A2P5EQK1_TREOI|nr:hypothetical protein TorRG33x02_163750 [Trema orientale]
MARMVKSCIQSILKLVNSVMGMLGIAMILYALWLIRVWQRKMDDHFPFGDSDNPAPWFIYTFLGLGITLCVITCSGHIAAATANAMILKALGPDQYYDSDDDYTTDRVPLLQNSAHPPSYVVGDPVYGSKSATWSIRINDKV